MNDKRTLAENDVEALDASQEPNHLRYRWRVRMEGTRTVYTAPARMTDEQAHAKYGDRLVERIESSARPID